MKHAIATALVLSLATPALADDTPNRFRDGLELWGDGARLMLDGLRDELAPFVEEEMLPFLRALAEMIEDLAVYELPERLPNGDIIIRRSPDAPPWPGPEEPGQDGVDL